MTTYQHDFVRPNNNRYIFVKDNDLNEKDICKCPDEQSDIPQTQRKHEETVEWTGIAPMGRLIDPRIIPTKFSADQVDAMANDHEGNCFDLQPNRFLKILRTAYPDLYERLKEIPKDELSRRLERQRMFTTYQIDFCNINEYPGGIYESIKKEDEKSKSDASRLLQQQGSCVEFKTNVIQELEKESSDRIQDPCVKAYKPFKISFADSARFVNSGNNSHWNSKEVFNKKANFTEYMDTINKIGCVIMKNKLHDHHKCSGRHCRHQLVHTCANLK